jgi:hypothetical protein
MIGEHQGYAAEITNEIYTSQNQRARNDRHSWVGLGPIHPNRVYLATYFIHVISFVIIWICYLVLEMADDRRAMYDGFSKKVDTQQNGFKLLRNS